MDNFLMNSFPENIKKEIEQIQKLILPLARKTSKYMFWTFPLIGIAMINLIYLLFFTTRDGDFYIPVIIYAVIGAFGFALLRETKLTKKEIERIGVRYIIERMKKSRYLTSERKNQYIHLVNEKPVMAMENFIKFLQEEDRLKRLTTDDED
ncbi:YwnF family protein [Caldifermentibacillus hisashii]|jgi:hypothetical protein|uniref:Uncharacterized protein n=2 Tax=Bacillaceae TaxID=186817 RepID=A0A090IWU1_9BACI|nr:MULTISPECIES: YwnF family protein [Bacillaceae]MCB5934727.1 YwnF family protein [Bacillus sp. DFI.2.34]AWI13366.1 hypothetical protein CQJ30_15150 [Caldibacillus thermoamylovorans]KIO60409.1 hypothetical protein B4064_3594 [Caldibacillus thermoamylovorans]KIO60887.1 hypothetical protein B4166_0267 [Caldibacillus thermoamylovorans]KIO61716.1 hypothetical protein B4065_1188 [Caldibacillus thermoamylovorans]